MRTIDADRLIVALKRKAPINDAMRVMLAECLAEVYDMPTIEPEIVRCKDCVYFPEGTGANHDLEFPGGELKCPCECDDYWYSWKPADDWFCANGKRKENES